MRVGDRLRTGANSEQAWSGQVTNILDAYGDDVEEIDEAGEEFTVVVKLDAPFEGKLWLAVGFEAGAVGPARLH